MRSPRGRCSTHPQLISSLETVHTETLDSGSRRRRKCVAQSAQVASLCPMAQETQHIERRSVSCSREKRTTCARSERSHTPSHSSSQHTLLAHYHTLTDIRAHSSEACVRTTGRHYSALGARPSHQSGPSTEATRYGAASRPSVRRGGVRSCGAALAPPAPGARPAQAGGGKKGDHVPRTRERMPERSRVADLLLHDLCRVPAIMRGWHARRADGVCSSTTGQRLLHHGFPRAH